MSACSLSIITPTLNAEATIRSTLESLRPLIEGGAEHIVVDSGSIDGTVDIARRFGSEVIFHPPGNMYEAINVGMAAASGEWLTYINGDDILFADYVVEAMASRPKRASVLYGDIDFVDATGRFLFSRRVPSPQYLPWLMRYYNPFPQQGALFSREIFLRANGFNTDFRFASDLDFFARCIHLGAEFWKFHGRSAGAFRLSPSQLSQRLREDMAPEGIKIRAQLRGRVGRVRFYGERALSFFYRVVTNVDGIFLRFLRGRGQDAVLRSGSFFSPERIKL